MAEKPVAVYGAMAANGLIALAKFVAGAITGSSAMVAEGIHSVVDTGNEVLLLVGLHRSNKPADAAHPFGYGKELYFWGLLVGVLLFGVGGGMSFYEGVHHLASPRHLGKPFWSFVVLGVAFVAESASWVVAVRAVARERETEGAKKGFLRKLHRSKDPTKFMVVGEDTAALSGLVVAFLGLVVGESTASPYPDAVASMVIGLILAGVSVYLIVQTRSLLLGSSATPETLALICELAESKPYVTRSRPPLTMHLGPHNILLALDVRFRPGLASDDLARSIEDLETTLKQNIPDIKRIFIEATLFGDEPSS